MPLQPRLGTPLRLIAAAASASAGDASELSAATVPSTSSSNIIVLPRRITTSDPPFSSGLGLASGPVPVPLPFTAIAPHLMRNAGTSASLHFHSAAQSLAMGPGFGLGSSGSIEPDDHSAGDMLLHDSRAGVGRMEHVDGAELGHVNDHEMSSPTAAASTLGLACETEVVSSQDEPLMNQQQPSMVAAYAGSSTGSMTSPGSASASSPASSHLSGRSAADQHAGGYHSTTRGSLRGAH